MPAYLCPSDGRSQAVPQSSRLFRRGRRNNNTTATGWYGTTYSDGLFTINRWRAMRDIKDGSSNTIAIGESVHPELWRNRPGL